MVKTTFLQTLSYSLCHVAITKPTQRTQPVSETAQVTPGQPRGAFCLSRIERNGFPGHTSNKARPGYSRSRGKVTRTRAEERRMCVPAPLRPVLGDPESLIEAKKESVFSRTGQEPRAPSLWELTQAENKTGSQRVQIKCEKAEP